MNFVFLMAFLQKNCMSKDFLRDRQLGNNFAVLYLIRICWVKLLR